MAAAAVSRMLSKLRRRLSGNDGRADGWLIEHPGTSLIPDWVAPRSEELVSTKRRNLYARSLAALERAARGRPSLFGVGVTNMAAVRRSLPWVSALADRLADLDRAVSPSGMAAVHDLLTDGVGPLYLPARAGELSSTIERILATLDRTTGERRSSRGLRTAA